MLIAIVGHIDHGKSSLVRALTGIETDRLPEEKKRGISIDLGFAYWPDAEGGAIGFVDVPGHERFIRNMLAGIGRIDFALLVIAADDGIMPQTIEHQQILELMGVNNGLVVLTKCDRVPQEQISKVRADIEELLYPTHLAGSKILEVSALTGAGISELASELRARNLSINKPSSRMNRFRFAIDRAFSITGAGTVVTGTVYDGSVENGMELLLAPSGLTTRVRGLQSAGKAIAKAQSGERCAINIAGLELNRIHRGDWLVEQGFGEATARLEVRLSVLASQTDPIKHNSRVHFHIGAADVEGRVLIPAQASITPGHEMIVQIVLSERILAVNGDWFIIRDQSGSRTLGGGRVLDPFIKTRRHSVNRASMSMALSAFDAKNSLRQLLQISHLEIDEQWFEHCFNLTPDQASEIYSLNSVVVLNGPQKILLSSERVAHLRSYILEDIASFHRAQPHISGMPIRSIESKYKNENSSHVIQSVLRLLIEEGAIASSGSFVKMISFVAAVDKGEAQLWARICTVVEAGGLKPFNVKEIAQDLQINERMVATIVNRKRSPSSEVYLMIEGKYFLRAQLIKLASIADELAQRNPNGFTAAQFRDASLLGRNIVIQILEYLDRIGITQRVDDLRKMRTNYQRILDPK